MVNLAFILPDQSQYDTACSERMQRKLNTIALRNRCELKQDYQGGRNMAKENQGNKDKGSGKQSGGQGNKGGQQAGGRQGSGGQSGGQRGGGSGGRGGNR